MEELLQFLCSTHRLSPECIAQLHKIVKFQKVPKGHAILKIGEVNRHLYFIRKGLLHCHYLVNDSSVSAWFFMENATVVSIGSFYNQSKSEDCIEPVEDTELFYITREEFDHLCRTYHDFCYLANLLFIKYLKEFQEHSRLIRKLKSKDRYDTAVLKYPDLFQRVPAKLLASWLSMEKETLSRGRSRNRGRKK
ncbi:MAG TPA: cyclic nucleotide-binding domain-containing protein [Puia sp.]|nr:cyclic nucleotide-binding domain-containing protein [Puia sp.]